MGLENQRVVVTGVAQGIGEATARTLAAKGCRLYLTDMQADKVAGVASEISAAHDPVDIGAPRSAEAMIADAIVQLGHIDSLVNIAGINGPVLTALEETEEHWRRIIDVDLSSPWWVSRAVLPPHDGTRRRHRHHQFGDGPDVFSRFLPPATTPPGRAPSVSPWRSWPRWKNTAFS